MRGSAWIWLALGLCLLGCGASPPPDDVDPAACEATRALAARSWGRLAELTTGPDARERDANPVDATIARLRAHARSLREDPPDEVDEQLVLELSGAVMDALDALSDLPEAVRRDADDAAEALLTERTAGGSMRATGAAVRALEQASGASDPEQAAARALRLLRRRARSIADGYTEDPRAGDRRLLRGEEDLQTALPPEIDRARTAAIEASRATREACRIPRTLMVPTL